jgi:soluble lytic murein transglycosylase-like protein
LFSGSFNYGYDTSQFMPFYGGSSSFMPSSSGLDSLFLTSFLVQDSIAKFNQASIFMSNPMTNSMFMSDSAFMPDSAFMTDSSFMLSGMFSSFSPQFNFGSDYSSFDSGYFPFSTNNNFLRYTRTRRTEGGTYDARAKKYAPLVEKIAKENGVNPNLIKSMIKQESGFNRYALSDKGAMGLMQLMPDTAREMGVNDPYDPEQNIRGGVGYYKKMLNRYKGNETNAIAAYNAGSGAVDKYKGVPPYVETQNYVKSVHK